MKLQSYHSKFSKLFFSVLFLSGLTFMVPQEAKSQTLQTVKGQLIDKETKSPVADATVIIKQYPANATTSDDKGFFQLDKVPLGRIDLRITKVGFMPVDLSNVQISAGKQTILNVEMEVSFSVLAEVKLSAKSKIVKERPLNDM